MAIVKLLKNTAGATAVELALVLPVLAVLFFGIVDFGRYFFIQHTLQSATREGARLALVGVVLQDEETRLDSILTTIKEKVSVAVKPGEVYISIFPVTGAYDDPEGWENMQVPGGPGDYMRVRTRYTYKFITPFIGDFFTGGKNAMQAEATYRNELFGNN